MASWALSSSCSQATAASRSSNLSTEFTFASATDAERSLVCPVDAVPENTVARDDGWRAFRVCGTLDFSLIGILAGISRVLADAGIGIFAVSTYDTDYVLVKSGDFGRALDALCDAGYRIRETG